MNTRLLILAAAATLGLTAQSSTGKMTANIPFAFEVNGKQMNAGAYDVRYSKEQSFATVRHARTGNGFLFGVPPTSGVRLDHGVLHFEEHSKGQVLISVSDKGTGTAIRIPRTRAGNEMAKASAISIQLIAAK